MAKTMLLRNKRSFCFIITCCAILFLSLKVTAQTTNDNFTQYAEKDGLPGAQVNSVLIDKLGYVWIGTINGLTRYDGYEFKRFYYNPNDSASILGLQVWSMFEDKDGYLWIASSPAFLNRYDPATGSFRQYKFDNLIPHSTAVELGIVSICQDNTGRIYFGVSTYYGNKISSALLYKDENSDELKKFIAPDSIDIKNVLAVKKDNKGNVFVLSYSGIYKIDPQGKLFKLHILDDEIRKSNEYITSIACDNEGQLWMMSSTAKLYDVYPDAGTYKVWQIEKNLKEPATNMSQKILVDKESNLWIGTNYGLYFFNRQTAKFSYYDLGLKKESNDRVMSDMSFDSFNNLWIGTMSQGLIKYENKPQLKSYTYNATDKNSITFGWAPNIYEASDGKIIITTVGSAATSGINILDPKTGDLHPIPYHTLSLPINFISTLWEYTPGRFYFTSQGNIFEYDEKTGVLKRSKIFDIPDSLTILHHLKDSRNNEWLTTDNGIYEKGNNASTLKYYDLSKLAGSDGSSNNVTGALESKKHGLWFITNNGLFLYNYNTQKIERHCYDKTKGDVLITQDVNSLYEDSSGIVWVGTWQGGLSKYNVETKKIKTYTRNDGLPSMSVQGIIEDEKNHSLWLSTFEGLSRFDENTEQFNNFSIADGIQGQLFADNSLLKTSTGLFAFGGSNGITIFNPDDVDKNSMPPKVFLTDLKLFDKSIVPGEKSILKKPVYETDTVIFEHDQNNLSIDFIALHYSNPSQNKYSYKLDNYDNEWRNVGSQHTAFYPNLPPGKYVFHVKATNDKGVWNEKGAALTIIINKPWWATAWAYVFYAVLLIILGLIIDRYVRKRIVRKEREKNYARELQQAKEIEKAYHKLEETHEALKSTQAQLIQSEKMASLGELTAGIAHEIQNPLNFVNNFSDVNKELLTEMKGEMEKGNINEAKTIANDVISNEEKINYHGKRADAIVKGMLQHSQRSSGQKEPRDINALCDEYLRLAYYGLRAKDKNFNAEIKTDFDDRVGRINVVPQDIGRVLLNLYNNAFYAVNEKKKSYGLSAISYEPMVSVQTKKLNDKIEISVKDNGNGVPQNIVDKIFQPFFTTKPTGQGTGLGLSLSYDIIKAHGGDLRVESEEGEGSSFIFQLPVNKTP